MKMQQFLGYSSEEIDSAKEFLHDVIDVGVDFKTRRRFVHPASKTWLDRIATEPLPEHGTGHVETLREVAEELAPHMPNFASPMFMGFPDAGNSLAGIAGAVLAELLNVNLINSTFCSQTATEMEIAVIRWLRELVGYSVTATAPKTSTEVGGMALTGGTLSNFTATLLARGRAMPSASIDGVADTSRFVVGAPEGIVHYTMRASLSWAGMGASRLVEFPIRNYKYDLDALDENLSNLAANGQQVILGVVYAGDSRTMTIDDLAAVSKIYRKHFPDIWMHCDGCHGTSLLFSTATRGALSGIEEYDSVTLDPHKVLNVPYSNSFLLLKDPLDANLVVTSSDLIMRQARSLGQTTPGIGSKQFSSLRTWMIMKALGAQGIGDMINRRLSMAKRFAELVDARPNFTRINDVNINSVVFVANPFRRVPLSDEEVAFVSDVTRCAYERILEDGRGYIHSFQIADNRGVLSNDTKRIVNAFRYMSGNPSHDDTNFEDMLDLIDEYVTAEFKTRQQNHREQQGELRPQLCGIQRRSHATV